MSDKLKIYCGSKISGSSYKAVRAYYDDIETNLSGCNFSVLNPMLGKEALRTEIKFKSVGYEGVPCATNHAIKERDQWMVRQADLVWMNFLNCDKASIGMISELAWADILGKHTIVTMQKDNVHNHAFVLEMADIIFESLEETLEYLWTFSATY